MKWISYCAIVAFSIVFAGYSNAQELINESARQSKEETIEKSVILNPGEKKKLHFDCPYWATWWDEETFLHEIVQQEEEADRQEICLLSPRFWPTETKGGRLRVTVTYENEYYDRCAVVKITHRLACKEF